MQSVKILHCADLHIGALQSFLGERSAARRIEALLTFESIVRLANENDVSIVLIAGDLFDSNSIEHSLYQKVLDAISSAKSIKFVFAAGNHDPLNSEAPFKKATLPSNLYILPCESSYFKFDDIKVRVYGCSFAEVYKHSCKPFSADEDEYINLACLHADMSSSSSSNYNPIDEAFIESSKTDYFALGHIHKRTEIKKVGNTFYAYCGCSEGQGFDEEGEKGVYIGDVSKGSAELEFVPICKRMHICESIDISNVNGEADTVSLILETLKKKYGNYTDNLYKLSLCGNTEKAIRLNLKEIAERLSTELYFVKLKDKSCVSENLDAIAKENSLKGIFVRKMLEKIKSEENKEEYEYALKIGLKAFEGDTDIYENQ